MNQKGFVTFEIILFAAAISIFAAVAVPKISQFLGKISLDYEAKRFYTETRFLQSGASIARYDTKIFKDNIAGGQNLRLVIETNKKDGYYTEREGKLLREKHFLTSGVKIDDWGINQKPLMFQNGNFSVSGHVIFESATAGRINMYFDSVGRVRGLWEDHAR